MREILFRGKADVTGPFYEKGKWVYGDYQHFVGKSGTCYAEISEWAVQNGSVIPETVGQYTGLIDKNGTKIFEGDIVTQPVRETRKCSPCVVEFHKGKFQAHYISDTRFFDRYYDLNSYTKVIGNIHDNPELLGGGE